MRRLSLGLLAVVPAALGSCIDDPGFACDVDAQCLVQAQGVCEAQGWCSYPDVECESRRRYGPRASQDVSRTCVPVGTATDGSGTGTGTGTGADTDGIDPPVSNCGNGVIDDDEVCDDGNRVPGDGCPAHCADPGTILWTKTWDGPQHLEERAYALAVDEAAGTFYVTGLTFEEGEGAKAFLQRWRIEDGELLWSVTHGGDGEGEDAGEQVAIDAAGNAVVAGTEVTEATGADVWLRKFSPDGATLWTTTHDEDGLDDSAQGVAITDNGEIVVVGWVEVDRGGGATDTDVWMRRFSPDGAPSSAPVVVGSPGLYDHAIDTVATGNDFLVTGRLVNPSGEADVWTARYDAGNVQVWEDLATRDLVGNEARGVGMGIDPGGGSATAGVLSNDIWVQRYDAAGTPGELFTEAGPAERHDEAADVAFLADGRFIVVGFVDFGTVGNATGDIWVRMHAADGTQQWTDIFDGSSQEIDKALAVEVTSDLSALVVGYETVPGQLRDVWVRRYAL